MSDEDGAPTCRAQRSRTQTRPAESVQAMLIEELAARLGVDPRTIDPRERFSRYGLDSLGATSMLAALSARLARPLSPTLVWEHPTIASLAAHLSSEGTRSAPAQRAHTDRSSADEPVAIIGLACRFPKAPSANAYWRLLRDGVDAISEVPPERWDIGALYDPDPGAAGKISTRWGGFLDSVDGFDPLFFSISPREATLMDPQQRLMLELSWEALEDAGLRADALRGSSAGVFFGVVWTDYATLTQDGIEKIAQHTITGFHHSIVANRVSYALGLEGPSLSVDTACSSSLVALHLAVESLRSGESTIALAGGVNLNLVAESTMGVSKLGALSPDGRCLTFDARANGYVRGEGGGVVVLKPLSRALADGDPIYCVIAGTAVNNDGESNGLTAPNPRAQEAVLRRAYERAGVVPSEVDYVEAHGTGTQLGDPIEARALGAVLGAGRPADRPLRIGSVKTNIGHLEAASGIAGLIKVALSLKHQEIPPSLHFETGSPHIPFSDLHLTVQRALSRYPDADRLHTAGVSAFGYGGTNAHVVLREFRPRKTELLALSADSREELAGAARRWLTRAADDVSLRVLAAEAAASASPRGHRLAVTARSRAELAEGLEAFLNDQRRPGLSYGASAPRGERGVVFVFSGQGSQWKGMGRALLETEPVFRSTLERCDELVQRYQGFSILDELAAGPDARLDEIDVTCPLIVSIEIALAALWRSWDIEPAAVVGHSIGEVAAAHVAGVLTLEDAMLAICTEGRFIRRIRGQGGMALVALSWEKAEEALAGYEGRLCRAIHASPDSTVVAGDEVALTELLGALQSQGVFCRRVQVDVAAHSPQLDPHREELVETLRPIQPCRARVPVVSTVTGGPLDGRRFDATHWMQNLADPVLFAEAIECLVGQGFECFVEVSPHPIVKHAVESSLACAGRSGVVLSTLRRNEDERAVLLDTLGALYALGEPVRWGALYSTDTGTKSVVAGPEVSSTPGAEESEAEPPYVLPLSARTREALEAMAHGYRELLAGGAAGASARDIAYTASLRRSHHDFRLAVVGRTREELSASLDAALSNKAFTFPQGPVDAGAQGRVVFVFSGQGSRWLGMGRQLIEREPVFHRALERCDALLRRHASWSLLDELCAPEERSSLRSIERAQPAFFALQFALAELWKSWGVEPDSVVGQSIGEIAAACTAGALSLEDAITVVYHRGRLLQGAAGRGRMASVDASQAQAERAIAGLEHRVSIAAINDPGTVLLSGEAKALEEVLTQLAREDAHGRMLHVDYAAHSPQVDPYLAELTEAIVEIAPRRSATPMYSTVTGELARPEQLGPRYWADNVRRTVRLGAALDAAISEGHRTFVEIAPHPTALASIRQCLAQRSVSGCVVGSLRRGREEQRAMLESIAALYAQGHTVAWTRLHAASGRCVPLPPYPWQRERYWVTADRSPRGRRVADSAGAHPLLGARFTIPTNPDTYFWEKGLELEALPYLAGHRVGEEVVLPGAAYVEIALAALSELRGDTVVELEEIAFEHMLSLPAHGGPTIQVALSEASDGRDALQIFSRPEPTGDARTDQAWVRHATMRLLSRGAPSPLPADDETPESVQQRCPTVLTGEAYYERLAARGLVYGDAFRGIERLWCGRPTSPRVGRSTTSDLNGSDAGPGSIEALGLVRVPAMVAREGKYRLHPAVLDACLQVAAELFSADGCVVPVAIERLAVHRRPGATVWAHARRRAEELTADLSIRDERGQLVAEVSGLRLQRLGTPHVARDRAEDWLYEVAWQRKDVTHAPRNPQRSGAWLILSDRNGTGDALCALLRDRGERFIRAVAGERYAWREPGLAEVRPAHPDDLDALLREGFGDEMPCRGVVHLFSLDRAALGTTSCATLREDQERGSLSALALAQALLRHGMRDMPRLWLVTRGAQAIAPADGPAAVSQSPLWGLGQVLALEHPELASARVDLSPTPNEDELELLSRELLSNGEEDQVALRAGARYVARLVRGRLDADGEPSLRLAPSAGRPFQLFSVKPGMLDRLALQETTRTRPGPGEVEVEVEAAGLNFSDVMKAMGLYPGLPPGLVPLGAECAGRIVAVGEGVSDLHVGDEVIALDFSSIATHVRARASFVARKPPSLSFEQAATMPLVFMTAWYAIHHLGRARRGESILIHSASGGIGLAAIQIARALGLEVFATAGNEEKRAYLRSLGIEHVMDSRSLSFASEIIRATNGRGVDLVLNSLTGEAMKKSLEILAPHGRFLELGKRDIYDNTRLGLSPFRKNITYSAIDLASGDRPELFASLLEEITQRLEDGTFQPLPVRSFPVSEAEGAFRLMAQAKHIGKVALSLRDPDARILAATGARDATIRPDASYLITGGLGGLGLSLARWMVQRGARHLVLVGRRAPSDAARSEIVAMEAAGAHVSVAQADVADAAQLSRVLDDVAERMPPLSGVVHAAMVLDDATVQHQNAHRFWSALSPKLLGAWNLHVLTRDKALDFFVLYSSAASLLGSAGQANYAAGNAFLDALAHHRIALGLPALSINWGAFSEVGGAAIHENRGARLAHRGLESLSPAQGEEVLGRLLLLRRVGQVGVVQFDVRRWLEFHPGAAGSPFWTELLREPGGARKTIPPTNTDFLATLQSAEPGPRFEMMARYVAEQLAQVLRLDVSRIDRFTPFSHVGLDSLMSLEVKHRLETNLDLKLSATLLFTYPTVAELSTYLLEKLELATRSSDARPAPPESGTRTIERASKEAVVELSNDELLARFDQLLAASFDATRKR